MDYQRIIANAKSQKRPVMDYASMLDKVFFPYLIWWSLVELFAFLVCSARAGKVPENETEMEELIRFASNISEQFLSGIGPEIKDERFFQILCEIGFEQPYVQSEMLKRTAEKQISLWSYVAPNFGGFRTQQTETLKWKALQDLRPSRFVHQDVMEKVHEGYIKAVDLIDNAAQEIKLQSPERTGLGLLRCPEFPYALNGLEMDLWRDFESTWDWQAISQVVKVMQLSNNAIQKAVWNFQRELRRTPQRQKKILKAHAHDLFEELHEEPVEPSLELQKKRRYRASKSLLFLGN